MGGEAFPNPLYTHFRIRSPTVYKGVIYRGVLRIKEFHYMYLI